MTETVVPSIAFSTEKRPPLQKLPGYSLFDQSRRKLEEMMHASAIPAYLASFPNRPEEPVPYPYTHYLNTQWENFILHDTKGTATLLVGLDMIKDFATGLSEEDGAVLSRFSAELARVREEDKVPNIPMGVKIRSIDFCMQYFQKHLLHRKFDLPDEAKPLEKLVNDAKTTTMIWPMLYHSALTLNSIAQGGDERLKSNIYRLKDTKVYARDVIKKASSRTNVITTGIKGKMQLDGIKGIMLLNLVKNAVRHSTKGVLVKFDGDEITVINTSVDPVTRNNLFEPGKPGKSGNTGFGLFTSRNIFGSLGGYDIVLNSGSDADGAPPYTVSFTIKPLKDPSQEPLQ
ncbi:MAG: hypothetical protein V1922_01165 [bacterium]